MDENTQPPLQAPPPPKNNSNILIGLLLFLLGILIGLDISKTTLLSGLRIPYIGVTPTPTPTLLPALSPTPDPTANWKTYTNAGGAISFKYPSSVSITDTARGEGIIITIAGLDKDISLVGEPTTQHDFYAGKKVSKTFVYNGISWDYLTGDTQFCDGGQCSRVSDALRTTNQGKRWTIVLGSSAYPDTTLPQILSTFTFTQ